jgi:hypothetical protein
MNKIFILFKVYERMVTPASANNMDNDEEKEQPLNFFSIEI